MTKNGNVNTTDNLNEKPSALSDQAIEQELNKADTLLKDFPAVTVMVPQESGSEDNEVFVHYNGLNIRFARNEKVQLREPIVEILEQAGMRLLRMDGEAAASMR